MHGEEYPSDSSPVPDTAPHVPVLLQQVMYASQQGVTLHSWAKA